MRIHGCFVTPELDKNQERFIVDGIDFTNLIRVTASDFKTEIGYFVVIERRGDRLYCEVEIQDVHTHEYLENATNPPLFFGVGGVALERMAETGADGRETHVIARCKLTEVALTPYGVHPDYRVRIGELLEEP